MKSPTEFNSLVEMMLYFRDEKTCLQYVEQWAWGGKVKCPDCKDKLHKVYRFQDGKKLKCSRCLRFFNVKTGTIFEDTKLPLIKWFMAMYFISSHKKGISSHQLAKDIKITQCRAYRMLNKIRQLMQSDEIDLSGVVMADESFIGGKNKNRHLNKKIKNSQGRSHKDKVPVLGLMQASVSHIIEREHKVIPGVFVDEKVTIRPDKVYCKVIKDTQKSSVQPEVNKKVLKQSVFVSDEWKAYKGMGKNYNHQIVDHTKMQYLSTDGYSTNPMEGFWTHLKKSLIGTYHRVTKKHLQKYLDEMCFRWNTRDLSEGERLNLLMSKVNYNLKFYT